MKHQLKKTSKWLSRVLRHSPQSFSIEILPGGWALISQIIDNSPHNIEKDILLDINDHFDKARFEFSQDQLYIRASHGHSIDVELDLKPSQPPEILFHGTADKNVSSIFQLGINPGSRQFVHLSSSREEALKIGQRHGKPTLLTINSKAMHESGHIFFARPNNIWLTTDVPVSFITTQD